MPHKHVWIPPTKKFESEILQALGLTNMYSFLEQDFANLRNSKIKIKVAFFVSSVEDLSDCVKISESMSFSDLNIFTTQVCLKNVLEVTASLRKIVHVNIFCLVTADIENHSLGAHVHYFTTDIRLYFTQDKIRYYWPSLGFNERQFFSQKRIDSHRKVEFVPFPPYNPDASEATSFSAVGEVLFESSSTSKPQLSVVIPHYDNVTNLKLCLKNLAEEILLSAQDVEVVLADDGSPGFSAQDLIQHNQIKNFKILRLPRSSLRQMGDFSYRAGVARNFGVEHASADKILFMDCDILIGHEFLNEVMQSLDSYGIIMPQRFQLQAGLEKAHSQIDPRVDVNQTATPYWTNFYSKTNSWDHILDKWKYVSTYCLALTKKTFYQTGPFSAAFVSYGCEDVDLGFKAYKQKIKFHLTRQNVYHLQPQTTRSEYEFDTVKKKKLLMRAFYYLYQSHLDQEIFDTLISGHIRYHNKFKDVHGN